MRRWLPLTSVLVLIASGCASHGAKMAWTFDASTHARASGTSDLPHLGGPLTSTASTTGDAEAVALPEDYFDELPAWNEPATARQRVLQLGWPLPATGVSSLFGRRMDPLDGTSRFHYGVDLTADYGQVVVASEAGRVAYSGWNAGHGRQVVIDHAGGYRTSYSHLSQTLVHAGIEIVAGQAVGRVGNSGRSTGAHLHYEVTRFGMHVDPLDHLGMPIDLE